MDQDERSSSPTFHDSENGRKRVRCSNFSSHEKNVLLHIIEKFEDIVESKKTDRVTLQEKDKVWQLITQEFNELSMSKPERTVKQLKMCYENLKRKLRRDLSLNSAEEGTSPANEVNGFDVGSNSTVPTLISDGDSVCSAQCLDSSFQGTSRNKHCVYNEEEGKQVLKHTYQTNRFRKRQSCLAFNKLQRTLLRKEIKLVEMDLKMRAKKYNLELQVNQAKLQYYQKKTSLLESNS